MRNLILLLALSPLLLASVCRAADATVTKPDPAKSDPTGTWKWSILVASNKTVAAQLKLQLSDGKLTGVAIGPDKQELPLEKAEFKEGRLRFEVTRAVQGRKFTTRYEGTITGDRISGKAGAALGPGVRSTPWEAERVPSQVSPPPPEPAPSQPQPTSNTSRPAQP